MKVRLTATQAAKADIRDIATYIAIDNPRAASQFGVELADAFDRIAENPDAGWQIPGFTQPLRFVRVSRRFRRYLIFYHRVNDETAEIIRVLHGARDIATLLAGSG